MGLPLYACPRPTSLRSEPAILAPSPCVPCDCFLVSDFSQPTVE